MITQEEKEHMQAKWAEWVEDWNLFAEEALSVRLDDEMKEILYAIQHNRRVSVCSCTSRGKDFLASVASICAFYLTPYLSEDGTFRAAKVINTGPTDRQVKFIMMKEVKARYNGSVLPILANKGYPTGRLTSDGIRMDVPEYLKGKPEAADYENWFMLAFKGDDHNTEAWTGFHSDNIFIAVTEASRMSKNVTEGIYGCLQGLSSKLLLVWNPNNCSGEAYSSQTSPQYKFFRLSAMTAPNVVNGLKAHKGEITQKEYESNRIPGQVDFEWVDEMVNKRGWTLQIPKKEVDPSKHDFEWLGKYYRPQEVFKIKVLAVPPDNPEGKLIPLNWIEAAMERWEEYVKENGESSTGGRIAVDVAGEGVDTSVLARRDNNFITLRTLGVKEPDLAPIEIAEQILKEQFDSCLVDSIGEGRGAYAVAKKKNDKVYQFKSSYSGKGITDETGTMKFKNARAYSFWALRDALNPIFEPDLMLPPDDELKAELAEIEYIIDDKGICKIEPKEDLKKRLGASPDKADTVSMLFAPKRMEDSNKPKRPPSSLGRLFS